MCECSTLSDIGTCSLQGEESVKERFTLDENKVVPFLEMEYDLNAVSDAAASIASGAAGKCKSVCQSLP